MARSHHRYADTMDEAVVRNLAETFIAEHHSPLSGGSAATALIPNGEFCSPVPRAVAVECLGDIAVADVIARRHGSTARSRVAFVRRRGTWQPVPSTLH